MLCENSRRRILWGNTWSGRYGGANEFISPPYQRWQQHPSDLPQTGLYPATFIILDFPVDYVAKMVDEPTKPGVVFKHYGRQLIMSILMTMELVKSG